MRAVLVPVTDPGATTVVPRRTPSRPFVRGKSLHDGQQRTTTGGDGRHNDVKRELSGVFHAITGANRRFKTGQIMDVGAEGLDVYNTMLAGMGVSQRMGPSDRPMQAVDKIRA